MLVAVLLSIGLAVGYLPAIAGAAAPVDSPSLTAPAFGAEVSTNPVLTWTAVPKAVNYRVQVSKSPSFNTTLYNVTTHNTMATVPTELPLGPIYWRVAATDGTSSGIGPFAESSFSRAWAASPQLLLPADGVALKFPGDAVALSWSPLAGASSYKVEVDDAPDFIGADIYTTVNTSFTLTEPQTIGQSFYWRVQGTTGSGTETLNSEWSATRSYSVSWNSVPQLVSPADGSTVQDVVLDWDPVPGAATYQLQVSPNGDWANNIAINTTVKGTRYSPPTTLNNSTYFWRVRAADAKAPTANLGNWSLVRQFTRAWPDRPELVAPANNDVAAPAPTFAWKPVPHASHYRLEVSTDQNFSPKLVRCVRTTRTKFTPYVREDVTPGEPREPAHPTTCSSSPDDRMTADDREFPFSIGTRYYWRVQAIDSPKVVVGLSSNTSASDTWSFIYRPDVPVPTAPPDMATVTTPVLQWSPVANAHGNGRYLVTIRKANGATVVNNEVTYATSYTPSVELKSEEGPFSWFVRTSNDASGTGILDENLIRRFSLVAPAETFATPEPLTPADGAASHRMPSMTWTPVTDAHTYRVFILDGGLYKQIGPPLRHAGFTYRGNETAFGASLSPGTYAWFVRAYDKDGALISETMAEPPRAFVISPLDVVAAGQYQSPRQCEASPVCAVPETPTLQWDPVPEAGSYRVYVAVDAKFTNIVREYFTNFTELTPRESYKDSQAGQAYYWFVRPCINPNRPGSPCGPFNESVHPGVAFRKASAAVKEPSDEELITPSIVEDEATFHWEPYLQTNQGLIPKADEDATSYRVQVATVNDFAKTIDERVVDQTTYTPFDKTYPEGPLFWRVQAIDGSGNALTWSPGRALTKSSSKVEPTAPLAGASVTGLPTFRWKAQSFAAKYTVEVYKNGDPLYSASNRVLTATTKLTAWAPRSRLPAGQYTWRVRRLDVDDRPGQWTEMGAFTLTGVGQPQLQQPAHGTLLKNNTLLFSWAGSQGASKYRAEVSTSNGFGNLFDSQTIAMPAWAPTKSYPDGQYYWRVHALNDSNGIVATSATRAFTKAIPYSAAVSLQASTTKVVGAGSVTLSANLTRQDTGAALRNTSVRLMGRRATDTSYRLIKTLVTDNRGVASTALNPRRHWDYQVTFPSSGVVTGAASSPVKVRYQPVVTADFTDGLITKGERTMLKGTISPHYRGQKIYLQKRASGRWRTVATKTLGEPTRSTPRVIKFSFGLAPTKGGSHVYRAFFPARKKVHLRAMSNDRTVRVR